jgi:hypothetical protein
MVELFDLPLATWRKNAALGLRLFGTPGADDWWRTRWTYTSVCTNSERVDVRIWFQSIDDMTHFLLVMER